MKTKVNYLNTSLDIYLLCIRGLCEIFQNKLRDILMFAKYQLKQSFVSLCRRQVLSV